MLKVRGIIAARSQNNVDATHVYIVEDARQALAIVAVIHNGGRPKGCGIATAAQVARNQGITCARRNAQVVFQHVPFAILAFYEVDARDVTVNALGWRNALALRQIARACKGKVFGHHAVVNDLLFAVDVCQVVV